MSRTWPGKNPVHKASLATHRRDARHDGVRVMGDLIEVIVCGWVWVR